MKKNALLVVAALLCAQAMYAQPVPSLYVPLNPCRLYDSRVDGGGTPFAAGVTRYLTVRGSCNVPVGANAVAMSVATASAAGNGNVKVWASSALTPAGSSFNFRPSPGSDSTLVLVQLSYPWGEDPADFAALASNETHLIFDVQGYFIPLPLSDPFPEQ